MGRIEPAGIQAVGLDLGNTLMRYDGVPLSWQAHYPEALKSAFAAAGLPDCTGVLGEACSRLARYNTRLRPRETEIPARRIFADVLGCARNLAPDTLDQAIDAFFGYFRQTYTVYTDVPPFLNMLATRGIPAGLLTDVPYGMPERLVEKDVEPFRPWLAVVLSSVDVGYRKPQIAGFIQLARALGAEPHRMAFIGDEEKDVAGARAAGMTAVLLDREGNQPSFGEDARLESLAGFARLCLAG